MTVLSSMQRAFLEESTTRYAGSLPGSPGEEYLESRGLTHPDVRKYRLGYVKDPMPGHEMHRGWIAIPYLRRSPFGEWIVISMRFRCIRPGCSHEEHGKYMSEPGADVRLFNTLPLQGDTARVGVCEGEFNAITACLCGVPTVGVPGAENWNKVFAIPFRAFQEVFALTDGDSAGRGFGNKVAKGVRNTLIIPSAWGEDVNSEYVEHGKYILLDKIGA